MAILNPYSKTTYVNGTAPDLNAVNLNKNEQGVYDVTEKVRELAAYETNAAASAVSAANSASSAASAAASAAAAVCADLAEDIADLTTDLSNLTTVVSNKANKTQSAWIGPTLINNWVNYGNGYQQCQYMKDEFGIVHIRGVVKGGTSLSVIFKLPVGYRPALNELFPSVQNNLFGSCTVFSDGNVTGVFQGTGASFCFGNISFVAV